MFIKGAMTSIKGVVLFVGGAVTSVEEAVTFIGKGGSAIKRLFKTAKIRVDDIKKVNKYNLR